MKISLLEPIGIDKALMDELSAPLIEKAVSYTHLREQVAAMILRSKDK